MDLSSLVDSRLVFGDLPGRDRDSALRELADRLERAGAVKSSQALYEKLLEREELGSTAIGKGVAIPHCKLRGLDEVIVAVGHVPKGLRLNSPDDEPVRLVFLVISPEDSPTSHLKSLAAISKWVKQQGDEIGRVLRSTSREELCAGLGAKDTRAGA